MKELIFANLYADFLQAAEEFASQAEDTQTYTRMLQAYARDMLDALPSRHREEVLPVVESLLGMFAQYKHTQDARLAKQESADLWQALLAKVVGTAVRLAKTGANVGSLKTHLTALYSEAGFDPSHALAQIAQAEAYGRCLTSATPFAASLAEEKTVQPYVWQQLCTDKSGQKNIGLTGMVGSGSSSVETEGEPHA